MCTKDRSCVIHVFDHLAQLLGEQARLLDHPTLGKIPYVVTKAEWLTIEVLLIPRIVFEGQEAWSPKLVLSIKEAKPSPAALWTWVDTLSSGLDDALLRAQALIERNVPAPWTTAEVQESVAGYESARQKFKQSALGQVLDSALAGRMSLGNEEGDA